MAEERRDTWPVVRKWLRPLIALAACGVLLLFLLLNYAPRGAEVRYSISMEGAEPALKSTYALGQNDYARDFTIQGTRMAGDQVAFYLNVPYQQYERALVKVAYRGDPEELLVKVGNGTGETATEPVSNRLLNGLDWARTGEGELMLLQREPLFSSVEEFMDSPRGIGRRRRGHLQLLPAPRQRVRAGPEGWLLLRGHQLCGGPIPRWST